MFDITKDLITVLTFLVTCVTAWATYELVKATKLLARRTDEMSQAMSRPHMVLSLTPHKTSVSTVEAILSNTGNATAYDVVVHCVPVYIDGRPCRYIIPFQTLSVFRPTDELRSCIYSIDDISGKKRLNISDFDELRDCRFNIKLSWKSTPTSTVSVVHEYELSVLDFGDIASKVEQDPLIEMMKSIQSIDKSLKERHAD